MKKALYPGSFDPITYGHMNLIEQASQIFDEIVIAIMINPNKTNYMFTPVERETMIKNLYKLNNKIKVIKDSSLVIDAAIKYECQTIIRGIRNFKDFEDEFTMCEINRRLSDNKINTLALFPSNNSQGISSSTTKELFKFTDEIDYYVPKEIKEVMIRKRENL